MTELTKKNFVRQFAHMKSENEEEHERNIKDMGPDDDYKSP